MKKNRREIDVNIAALAFPALGALIAEPLFLALDSAMVGHLGATPLAGLAIASSVLTTVVGLMVFLAYSTTPLVSRRRGAGDLRGAVQAGIDGIWLALGIGIVVALALWFAKDAVIAAFRVDAVVAEQASIYLGISALGVPAMLIVFAATGLLRGLLDTVTPLWVAGVGFAANALMNWVFMYVLGWGIAGSAWGTVYAQWGMVIVYLLVVARHTRTHGASVRPHRDGIRYAGRSGGWLFVRTLGLRAALLATVAAAAFHGAATTAGYQIVFMLITITAFMLDALAIAAQALIGDSLGASNAERARLVLRRTMRWGIIAGVVVGGMIAALSPVIGYVFTSDPHVLALLPPSVILVGLTLPLGAVVYVLDGVLMGAGDVRYLAVVSLGTLALYLPVLWWVTVSFTEARSALTGVTLAFTLVLMTLRAATLLLRARGERWVVLGAR